MKVIVNFGEKKVVVPCGTNGDLLIRELIQLATAKYRKLSLYNDVSALNSDQIQLRLNNGAVVDPDDRVCDVVDDREELFTIIDSSPKTLNSNGELSSSMTSSNLSTSLSDQERSGIPPSLLSKSSINHRHEVIVTDADLRTRSLRIKTESINPHVENNEMYNAHRDEKTGDQIFTIILPKENSPLGIHVIPYNSNENQVNGLVLQNIESDGRIKRQGILEINDRIIEINRINIEQCSFEKAQLIFRNALLESELELKIVRNSSKKSSTPFPTSNSTELNPSSKRLGKIIKITLVKGVDGLGFKLASRDNPTGVANPIYVKTIFPKGAAIEDGRLQNGDRLLMVNSIDVTQMSLQETVGLLRETRIGDTVHLCISRQQDGSLPKDLLTDEMKTQIMTFDIPLRDTSSAGLGITLKGKTSIIDGQSIDLGIFVKSILTGGAAYRDNRLRSNDQILIINNSSLVNLSNLEAASILHDAVRKEIQPGYIKITISRDEQNQNSKNIKEVELLPPNNEENELDLTNFVPTSSNRKTPSQDFDNRTQTPIRMQVTLSEKQNQEEIHNRTPNPFERETPFRQSISEKRRLNQQSFHETRTNSERRHPPTRMPTNSSTNMIRSTSYESISQMTKENDEQKRQIKSRHRACNDSFRQAVDRSYNKNNYNETINGDRPIKVEKTRFKFTNLFTTKSKRKDNQEEKSSSSIKTLITPPPPSPFSSQQDFAIPKAPNIKMNSSSPIFQTERKSTNLPDCQPLSYQPYRFDVSNRSSSTVHHQKSSHPPIPRQFLQTNITGTQSLRQHHLTSRSPYPSNQRLTSDSYLQQENPANV